MVACGKGNMLRLKNLFENFDLAKECLKQYDADGESLDTYLSYFRVSSNAIYPFRAKKAEKVCFLRLSPVEEKSIQFVRSEIQLIEWLIGQGFPAMKPFPMKDGQLWAVVDTKWGVYNMSCFEAVPGKTLEDCDGSPRLIAGYGRTLGQMHRLLRSYCRGRSRWTAANVYRNKFWFFPSLYTRSIVDCQKRRYLSMRIFPVNHSKLRVIELSVIQ